MLVSFVLCEYIFILKEGTWRRMFPSLQLMIHIEIYIIFGIMNLYITEKKVKLRKMAILHHFPLTF